MGFQDRIDVARLARRVSGRDLAVAAQLVLVALLAFLTARLIWSAVVPIGPIGTPALPAAVAPRADAAIFARFDPFFQMAGASGPVVVSDLNIDLFGTRVDNVSGRGSAIISADGGPQASVLVGEEVLPGVQLHSVAFDSVTVSRGGTLEQLFLDQSIPARPVTPPSETPPPADSPQQAITVQRIAAEISAEPLVVDGRIEGVTLQPADGGSLVNEIGLQPGDVLLSVNRARIDTKARAGNIADLLGDADVAVFEVRRGAEVMTLSFEITR